MRIEIDDVSRPEVLALLEEHLRNMYELTPPEYVFAFDASRLRAPGITFWTAWEDGTLTARPFTNQSSGVLRSLVEADALVVTPAAGREATGSKLLDEAERLAEAIDLRRHL